MKVWRIHLKNDEARDDTDRMNLKKMCLNEEIIGVGWSKITTRDDSEDKIRKQAQENYFGNDAQAGLRAVNAMRKMRIGDLIWTRLDPSSYCLCRVTGLWKDQCPTMKHDKYDISNYVKVEWLKIGMEQNVPGKVLSSFRPNSSVQAINGVEDISMYIWNKYSRKDAYKYKKVNTQFDIWTILSSEAVEELVILYLQVEKGYYVYSTTVKFNYPEYECQLVNKNGNHAYPQVKTGNESLNADDYLTALKTEPDSMVYLFAVSQKYSGKYNEQVKMIYKNEIENFIKKHKKLLPQLTRCNLELCGFI